jgi:hypothetical protein
MAISVKQFPNPLNCDEPAYAVQVAYDVDVASGGADICNGNGTNTVIYGDYTTLADIYSNSGSSNAANANICDEGMDVIFVVDYTSSMSNAINGVKTGIANIAAEINTQTSGNYRLGLVLYDEYQITGSFNNIFYAGSGFYQNLPSAQKLIQNNTSANRKQVYTCVEKMSTVGNIGNSTSGFTQALNAINQSNSSTGMALGNGHGVPEPGGLATYLAAVDNFAGSWRSGVLKLIVHITDSSPGGDDDIYNNTDVTYFQNTLTSALDNQNVQFFHNSSASANSSLNSSTYKYLVENTTPIGLGNYSVNYSNSNWIDGIITGIQDLCDETTTYSCDPAPAGWYADLPITLGTTVAYYWNGTAWTNSYACPLPVYTVKVDIVDGITTGHGSVDNISPAHVNYFDSDTFEFSGNPGQVFTATVDTSVAGGYQNLSLNVSNVSDVNVITGTSLSNNPGSSPEVTIQVTIGNGNSTESIQINGTATVIQRTLRIDIIGDIVDILDASNNSQSPSGYIDPQPSTPAPSSWTNVGIGGTSVYSNYAYRTEITDNPGTSHTVDVGFDRIPSDYILDVDSVTTEGYNMAGNGGGTLAAALDTVSGMVFNNGNQASASWAGNATIGNSDLWVKAYFGGDADQPSFRITVYASETITGASLIAPTSSAFNGYTGDTFNFSKLLQLDAGYTNLNVTGVIANVNYSGNAALSNIQATSGNDGGEATVTMPNSTGTSAGIVISGTTQQIAYNYVITVLDLLSTTTWSQVTLTAVAGGAAAAIAYTPITNNEYTYNITTISNDDSGNLTSVINSASAPSINLTVGSMPLGGGSASVTLGGTQTPIQYTFDLDIVTDNGTSGNFDFSSVVLTGAAGDVITGTFTWLGATGYEYTSTGHSTTSIAIDPITYVTNQLLSTNYTVTMPSGGGNGTITCDDVQENAINYSYDLGFDDTFSTTFATNATITPSAPITLTGPAGTQINWQYTVTPSPSYYQVDNFVMSEIVTYSGNTGYPGGNPSNTGNEISVGYTSSAPGGNAKLVGGSVTMPSGGGSGSIMPTQKTQVFNPSFDFIITGATNINNTSISGTNPVTLTGKTGDALTTTFDVVSGAGYTHNVTGVTIANNYSNAVTGSATVGEDMKVDVVMPTGGGSTTATATGSSSQQAATLILNFTEGLGVNDGEWDNTQLTFSGAENSIHNISNSWRIPGGGNPNGREFGSNSITSYNKTGANGDGQNLSLVDPFNGTLSGTTPSSGTAAIVSGTLTMPPSGGTYSMQINVRGLVECDCIDGTTPPLFNITNETNSNNNGLIGITFNQSCGSSISSIDYSYNGGLPQNANNLFSVNTSTYKELRQRSAGSHAFTIQYDHSEVCLGTHTITASMSNITTTTTSTTSQPSGPGGGRGFGGPTP